MSELTSQTNSHARDSALSTAPTSQQTSFLQQTPRPAMPKRLILCCDGTWMDSLGKGSFEPPSNVTRLARGLRRNCSDGTHQIISYFAGVGTANAIDQFTGGAFGMGLDRDIRLVYNFICTNYVDGDEILLVGFSRGAFTARSTADMIASVGLLTPEGLDHFYRIFEDYEHIGDVGRDADEYLVEGLPPFKEGLHGQDKIKWEDARMRVYKEGLKRKHLTRDTYSDGTTEIRIKALGVWDTVGTLGIPPAPVIGVRGSADQWRFTNTQVSDKVENAFQALGLDEPRYAFRPALWERLPGSKTHLKQVWFPGTHANVGGGWYDQQLADISLAWMADQLSTLGVEFNFDRMTAIFTDTLRFSARHPFPYAHQSKAILSKIGVRRPPTPKPWSSAPSIFQQDPSAPTPVRDEAECDGKDGHPELSDDAKKAREYAPLWHVARPWGLGLMRAPTSVLQNWAGKTIRRPGLSVRVDETTNEDTTEPLLGTNETIHSSVRVRLACGGLGVDDKEVWGCEGLLAPLPKGDQTKPLWKLERDLDDDEQARRGRGYDRRVREIGLPGGEYPEACMYPVRKGDCAWKWTFTGKPTGQSTESQYPQQTTLREEPLVGYWERYLLAVLRGEPDVWRFAEGVEFGDGGVASDGKADRVEVEKTPVVKVSKRASFLGAFGK